MLTLVAGPADFVFACVCLCVFVCVLVVCVCVCFVCPRVAGQAGAVYAGAAWGYMFWPVPAFVRVDSLVVGWLGSLGSVMWAVLPAVHEAAAVTDWAVGLRMLICRCGGRGSWCERGRSFSILE